MPNASPDPSYLLKVLRDLVGFRTVAPPGNSYREIIDYLASVFDEMGFKTQKVVIPQDVFSIKCDDPRLVGERVNLIAHKDVGAKETLVIYTHVDVVPAGDGWAMEPFDLTVTDGKAYGRGSSDSKGAVAGLIGALKVLSDKDLKYNLRVLLTTDEEVGGYSGLCFLTDQGAVFGNKMLCMDGFSDDVVIGSNGIITWEAEIRGKRSHSGSSFLGVNAIEKSLPVMEALMALKEKVQSRRSSLDASSALSSLGIEKLMPILNITVINGGIKENIVPDRCVLRGDRRVIPEETMEGAMEEMQGALADVNVDISLRFFPGYPPMSANPDHSWVAEVRDAVKRSYGFVPRVSGAQGSLDQAYATDKTKMPTCVYGVGRQMEANIHAPNENIRLADLESYARFLIELMAR